MKYRTLIVDDDQMFIFIAKRMIVSAGFDPAPLSFKNGKLALEYILNNRDDQAPFVVFLDINMPVMNGWQFLDGAAEAGLDSIMHVFIVSSSSDQADKNKASTYPVVLDYLEKPVPKEVYVSLKERDEIRELMVE